MQRHLIQHSLTIHQYEGEFGRPSQAAPPAPPPSYQEAQPIAGTSTQPPTTRTEPVSSHSWLPVPSLNHPVGPAVFESAKGEVINIGNGMLIFLVFSQICSGCLKLTRASKIFIKSCLLRSSACLCQFIMHTISEFTMFCLLWLASNYCVVELYSHNLQDFIAHIEQEFSLSSLDVF